MNMKQFQRPANGHARMHRGRGGRGFRLQSKLGQAVSLTRLEKLLADARRHKAAP